MVIILNKTKYEKELNVCWENVYSVVDLQWYHAYNLEGRGLPTGEKE